MENENKCFSHKKGFKTSYHSHFLFFLSSQEKKYPNGDWFCDVCNMTNKFEVSSMHCPLCEWDLCDQCFFKEYQYLE